MKSLPVAFMAALIFGLGLGLAGMTLPSNVIGFLDIAGAWDISLAFVMVGAIATFSTVYWSTRKRIRPLLAASFQYPEPKPIDRQLLLGAVLFGIGWGLAGFCPGPALVSAVTGRWPVLIFLICMAAGIFFHDRFKR